MIAFNILQAMGIFDVFSDNNNGGGGGGYKIIINYAGPRKMFLLLS